MDRHAMARAARRRQVEDALAFERDREKMLVEQLEEVVAETDGRLVDDVAFAAMEPDDAELVRAVLRSDLPETDDDEEFGDFDEPEDAAAMEQEELARLNEVLDACRRTQRALERYLRAIDGAP
jgi:hypothetical protein